MKIKNKHQKKERYIQIAFQIQKDLSKIISKKIIYLNIKFITITKVEIKAGNNNAKIFFNIIKKKKNIKNITNILNKNSKYFRKKLSKYLSLYNTPKLKFIYDNSFFYNNRILNLIKIANKKK
ncbi:30S ribosome-binding factor RbfA [Candidatus Zinderia endosymbiont of Aphrophora alni]|uniref:30S ribosome-binding factor RbfA n=1 Tax=Candidatus Zinderia endosymbiont of Aphrophora alni TaxID=3077951 RepID=UPI0030D5796C